METLFRGYLEGGDLTRNVSNEVDEFGGVSLWLGQFHNVGLQIIGGDFFCISLLTRGRFAPIQTLRIQVCPKEWISLIILWWGWDWDHQTYSREGYGSFGKKWPTGKKGHSNWWGFINAPLTWKLWGTWARGMDRSCGRFQHSKGQYLCCVSIGDKWLNPPCWKGLPWIFWDETMWGKSYSLVVPVGWLSLQNGSVASSRPWGIGTYAKVPPWGSWEVIMGQ